MWSFADIDFVIDERPVTLAAQSARAADQVETSDLVGQIGDLMAKSGKLAAAVSLLERSKGETDEMDGLMRRILPVLDGFERILTLGREMPEDETTTNWLRSIEGLFFRLRSLLEKAGLFGIEAVGQPVNLDMHEVVEYRHSPDHKADTVIALRQRGYVFRGQLIRDAKVVVASNERS